MKFYQSLLALIVMHMQSIHGVTIKNLSDYDIMVVSYDDKTLAFPFIAIGEIEEEFDATVCCVYFSSGPDLIPTTKTHRYRVKAPKVEAIIKFTGLTSKTKIIFGTNRETKIEGHSPGLSIESRNITFNEWKKYLLRKIRAKN